jgi:SRSO17 transposase
LQQFIYRGRFSADDLRDELRSYVGEELGEEDGTIVMDDTGFLKKGKKSCGVKRQYSGTAGRIENCQIGVFLSYASKKGNALIDRRLYLPKEWIEDKERRDAAGVPKNMEFRTKPEMAFEMLKEATECGIPYTWVTGDCAYGDYRAIRTWLEENRKCYAMSVSGKEYVWKDSAQVCVGDLLKSLPDEGWFTESCGSGSKGERLYDWMIVEINPPSQEGHTRFMLVRRSKTEDGKLRAYICFAPIDTPIAKFIEIIGVRWTIETCFQEAKTEVGLDQYEVRSFDGWYKHITFSCLALALLSVFSVNSLGKKPMQECNPASSSLEAFKKGRKLRV